MKTKIEQTNAPAWSPGPWDIHGDITRQAYYVHGANAICDMRKPSGFYRSPRETEANARLIAAAPEMAEALRVIASDGPYSDPSGDTESMDAWLARADEDKLRDHVEWLRETARALLARIGGAS